MDKHVLHVTCLSKRLAALYLEFSEKFGGMEDESAREVSLADPPMAALLTALVQPVA